MQEIKDLPDKPQAKFEPLGDVLSIIEIAKDIKGRLVQMQSPMELTELLETLGPIGVQGKLTDHDKRFIYSLMALYSIHGDKLGNYLTNLYGKL